MNYYPIVRGRQFDLAALTQAAGSAWFSRQIIPIIEPVKDNAGLPKVAAAFEAAAHPLFIIQNPQAGSYGLLQMPRYQAGLGRWVQPARYFDGQKVKLILATTAQQAKLLAKRQLAVIPDEARLRALNLPQAIYLDDHYPTRERTENYYELQREPYQFPLSTLPGKGFADYLLSTGEYDEHGYPQRAIALHLLYPEKKMLYLHHFVSVNNEDFSQPNEKFFEALTSMQAWLQAQPAFGTQASGELLGLLANRHFPGLGSVRKLQVLHFLETMSRWLDHTV